jgi:hypothetical protein
MLVVTGHVPRTNRKLAGRVILVGADYREISQIHVLALAVNRIGRLTSYLDALDRLAPQQKRTYYYRGHGQDRFIPLFHPLPLKITIPIYRINAVLLCHRVLLCQ